MRLLALSLGLLFVIAFIALLLPSCAEFPVTARIVGPDGTLTYNKEAGLGIEIRAGK